MEGQGAVGINFDETLLGYDLIGRTNRVVDPTGTIDRTVYDVRGLATANWSGTNDNCATDFDPTGGGATGNNMVRLGGMEYDNGTAGGDGNLTTQTDYVDATTVRTTVYAYDFRSRNTVTDGEEGFYQELFYDNLNHVIRVDRLDSSASGNLIARSATNFDDRGRVYQTLRYAVNPGTGTVGNSLIGNTWYDASNNVLCMLPSGSQTFTKTKYDGVSRSILSYAGYNPSAVIVPNSVASDLIFAQS